LHFAGHAFVDWDDTITENIRYFREAERANVDLIARLTGADPAVVQHRGEELDVIVARQMGLVKESMTVAWTACYREFCQGAAIGPDPETEAAIGRACLMPYEVRQEVLPGAPETLEWLKQAGFEITVWTAGDHDVQERKIRESGLQSLVHRAAIVIDKTAVRLRTALDGRNPAHSFVVGNSIHSDVRPALEVGMTAYHIPVETWAYDRAELNVADPNYQRVEYITDLPALLSARFRLAV